MKIAKSNVRIKVESISSGTQRNGYLIYFDVYVKGEKVETRAMPSAKKIWNSQEQQYIYYYKENRFWNLKMLKEMIKNDVCYGVVEVLNK